MKIRRWNVALVMGSLLVLGLVSVVSPQPAAAYCAKKDSPQSTGSVLSGASETVRYTTTCDGKGDYYGKVNDTAAGDGRCAFVHVVAGLVGYDCDNNTSSWVYYYHYDASSSTYMTVSERTCGTCGAWRSVIVEHKGF